MTFALLRLALRRPARADAAGIAACATYQVAVIAVAAVWAQGQAARADPPGSARPRFGELLTHNATAYLTWVAGAATLGLLPLVLGTGTSLLSGWTIGGAIAVHGPSALLFLGHALLEIPAFAIALWLAVRPAGLVWAAGRGRRPSGSLPAGVARGALWLTALAMLLLVLAALWESEVVPSWIDPLRGS